LKKIDLLFANVNSSYLLLRMYLCTIGIRDGKLEVSMLPVCDPLGKTRNT